MANISSANKTAGTVTHPGPIPQHERTVIVDIIRGFALLGVLVANFNSYNIQNLPSTVFNSISSPLDNALNKFDAIFLEWKFMTLFSILFGYGFGLIITSLEKKNISPTPFFLRRMFWLFVFGVIHTLFWWGDVLHLYATAGILLLLFRKASAKNILVFSFLCMFVLPPAIPYFFRHQTDYFTDQNLQILYERYKYGHLRDVFSANFNLYYKAFILTGDDVHDIIETLGRFLFGYFLLRIKLFESVEQKKAIFRKVLVITAPVMIAYFFLRWLSLDGKLHTTGSWWGFGIKMGILATTSFYTCSLVWAYISFGRLKIFAWLLALGKMTLTNYLLVSAFLVILLYGIGFGKLGEISMHMAWVLALIWIMVEIIFSTVWLTHFRFGPLEWIWRQLTYKKRIQLRHTRV